MRSLETMHLDELESTSGVAINLEYGYARRLAQVAANKYGRRVPLFEDTSQRETSATRFLVGYSHTHANQLKEVMDPDRRADTQGLKLGFGYMKTPSETAVAWSPETDLPEANQPVSFPIYTDELPPPPEIKKGDRINYTHGGPNSMWNGSLVTGIVKKQPFKGQLLVTAPTGEEGIISHVHAELSASPATPGRRIMSDRRSGGERRAPESRSQGYALVGTYEMLVEPNEAGETQYRRLGYTSFPDDVVQSMALMEQAADALNTVACLEHGLDQAQVFTMFNAETFEQENEGRLL